MAVITLVSPNGNFPILVSTFNAQSLITPADFTTGTTLDGRPAGTGAWILDSYTEGQSVKFSPNPNWWGGNVNLASVELQQFEATDTMVTALQAGSIDAIQQFSVIGGEGILDNPDFTVTQTEAATHRQVWFNTAQGQFSGADPRVRQAMTWTFDREEMVALLFGVRPGIGNDHPIIKSLPFYDPTRYHNGHVTSIGHARCWPMSGSRMASRALSITARFRRFPTLPRSSSATRPTRVSTLP